MRTTMTESERKALETGRQEQARIWAEPRNQGTLRMRPTLENTEQSEGQGQRFLLAQLRKEAPFD